MNGIRFLIAIPLLAAALTLALPASLLLFVARYILGEK